ncbi:MAG TPA: protein tyrosine phosphatase-like domain-containing protein [Chitinophagales bacterium]|nr:protein tyrosine phosphatase-like domain-containing protein [Chitinophagales bacterium]
MKRNYLIAYNLILAIGWAAFVGGELLNGFAMDAVSLLLLNICQGAAVLEIVHAARGWVSSPVFTTFIQVFSRLFVLVFINLLSQSELIRVFGITGVTLVTLAWGITEMVRYSYYFVSLLNKQIQWLTFLRYTLFIGLYPMGVSGEWMILLSAMKANDWSLNAMNIFLGIVLLSYLPFFPKLYMYMWRQRKKKV